MDSDILFTVRTFTSPENWDKRHDSLVGSKVSLALFVITVPLDEVAQAAAWIIENNPGLDIEFQKGLNQQHADNFIHNRASVLFKVSLK
jgi:hypothetical protein